MGDKAIKIEQGDDAEEQQKQPPRKVTEIRGGRKRDYHFLKTVNSLDELDNFRFKNSCHWGSKPLPAFTSIIMQCSRKRAYKPGKQCDFELLGLRQKSGSTINVYAHSQHNHQLMPEEKRASVRRAKELMPAKNPPKIFHTEDNIEWTFIETFADFDQMQKFRRKSQCTFFAGRENHQRFRLPCTLRKWRNCEFQLLALKTTNADFHVYKLREHNHPTAVKSKKKQQPAARGQQQKQPEQEMEVDEEEGQEDNEEEQEGESEEDETKEDNEEEDDDIIVIDGEDDGIKIEQQQQEEKPKGSKEKTAETPQGNEANPRVETLEEMLHEADAKVYYKWMAGIEANHIGPTVVGMNIAAVLKMVEMADQEVRKHPAKFVLWRPWLKYAIKNCVSQMDDFYTKYKNLIIRMVDHVQD